MELISIIQGGDIPAKQHELRAVCEKIREGVRTSNKPFPVMMKPSQKQILFPVFDGLGVPYRDEGVNGVFFGRDMDSITEHCDQI